MGVVTLGSRKSKKLVWSQCASVRGLAVFGCRESCLRERCCLAMCGFLTVLSQGRFRRL